MPKGRGITTEQKQFIQDNKDEMFIGQMARLTGLSITTVHKYTRV